MRKFSIWLIVTIWTTYISALQLFLPSLAMNLKKEIHIVELLWLVQEKYTVCRVGGEDDDVRRPSLDGVEESVSAVAWSVRGREAVQEWLERSILILNNTRVTPPTSEFRNIFKSSTNSKLHHQNVERSLVVGLQLRAGSQARGFQRSKSMADKQNCAQRI